MSVSISKNPDDRTKSRVWTTVKNLENLPKTVVTKDDDLGRIYILNSYQYVPDFRLVWCNIMKHFRVYIFVVPKISNGGEGEKISAGYPIMNITNGLVACAFCAIYHFLHRYRSNVKA